MKSILRITTVLILLLMIFTYLPHNAYAMDGLMSSADSFIQIGEQENAKNQAIDEGALKSTSDYIYNILFTIAIVLSVAIGMIIGIQFMVGSADEKAKVKETLVPYVVGVFVVFASFTIWKIVVTIGSSL